MLSIASIAAGWLPAYDRLRASSDAIESVRPPKALPPRPFFPVVPVWTVALNNAVMAAPGSDDNSIYVPIEGSRIVAYDLASATLRWIAPFETALAPAAGGDRVFIVEPHAIAAAYAATGQVAWQLPFGERIAMPLVWNNGWLFATTTEGGVLAFRAADGQMIWRRDLGSPPHARPGVSGERIYVPTDDGRVVALQVESGEPVWERRLGGSASDVLAFDDRLFVGSRDNYLYCLSADTGRDLWRWRTGADVVGLPASDETAVYFVSLDNVLRALNRGNGSQRWQRPLPIRPTAGPVKIGDTLVVTGLTPVLRGYSARTGAPAGELTVAGDLVAPPQAFENAQAHRPELIVVTRDIAKGASIAAVRADLEPRMLPIGPLPNVSPVAPLAGTPPATR